MSAAILLTGLEVARIGLDLLTGARKDPVEATAEIAQHLLKVVPLDDLRAHLAEEDRKIIDAATDVAEETKLKETNQ